MHQQPYPDDATRYISCFSRLHLAGDWKGSKHVQAHKLEASLDRINKALEGFPALKARPSSSFHTNGLVQEVGPKGSASGGGSKPIEPNGSVAAAAQVPCKPAVQRLPARFQTSDRRERQPAFSPAALRRLRSRRCQHVPVQVSQLPEWPQPEQPLDHCLETPGAHFSCHTGCATSRRLGCQGTQALYPMLNHMKNHVTRGGNTHLDGLGALQQGKAWAPGEWPLEGSSAGEFFPFHQESMQVLHATPLQANGRSWIHPGLNGLQLQMQPPIPAWPSGYRHPYCGQAAG
jgi:hypothetical protein